MNLMPRLGPIPKISYYAYANTPKSKKKSLKYRIALVPSILDKGESAGTIYTTY
jgi:hypothetical protein